MKAETKDPKPESEKPKPETSDPNRDTLWQEVLKDYAGL
jgi:hypothetical protein